MKKLDKKSFGVGLVTPFAIAMVAKLVASFTCCVWVGLAIITILLITWKLMFTNTNFRKNVKRSVRVFAMIAIVVVLSIMGVAHYMSHRPQEVGCNPEPTPVVEKPVEDVVEEETKVSENDDDASNKGYTAPAGTVTKKPDVKTTNVSSQKSEFTIGATSDNNNNTQTVEERNTFTFETTDGEPKVEVVEENEEIDNNDDIIEPAKGEDISKEEVDNSQNVVAEEKGGETETDTEVLPEVKVTGDVLVFDDEEDVVSEKGNIEKINTLEKEDTVVEEKVENKVEDKIEDKVIDKIQPQDEIKEEVVEIEDKTEEVKSLEVVAVDGYETVVGSQVQFKISDENAVIDGLDGIDYNFNDGILTVNVGEEATTLTVDVLSGSQMVTFDINVNGIIR